MEYKIIIEVILISILSFALGFIIGKYVDIKIK